MKNPQTLAKKLSELKTLDRIADSACCAFVTLWALGIEPEDSEAILMIDRAMKSGVLDKDCTVKWVEFARSFTGKEIDVEFMTINKLTDLNNKKSVCNRFPVRYDFNNKSHWVGVEDGKIAFNPLEFSLCVKMGKPAQARILTLSK